jgi:acetyl esterase/lipase
MHQRDEVWLKIDGKKFEVRVYRPEGDGPFPAILDVHGGAWTTLSTPTFRSSLTRSVIAPQKQRHT